VWRERARAGKEREHCGKNEALMVLHACIVPPSTRIARTAQKGSEGIDRLLARGLLWDFQMRLSQIERRAALTSG
jgi:hypothetical protein